jgi:hypothetical protein
MATVTTHGARCGIGALCAALDLPTATYYRAQHRPANGTVIVSARAAPLARSNTPAPSSPAVASAHRSSAALPRRYRRAVLVGCRSRQLFGHAIHQLVGRDVLEPICLFGNAVP